MISKDRVLKKGPAPEKAPISSNPGGWIVKLNTLKIRAHSLKQTEKKDPTNSQAEATMGLGALGWLRQASM